MKKLLAFVLMLGVSMFTFAGCGETKKPVEKGKAATGAGAGTEEKKGGTEEKKGGTEEKSGGTEEKKPGGEEKPAPPAGETK